MSISFLSQFLIFLNILLIEGNKNELIGFFFKKIIIFILIFVSNCLINRSDDDINVQSSSIQQKPILTLYTKNPCPLCDELVEELAPYMHRLHLEEVDITKPENRTFFKQYRYDIPVLHFNGEFLCMHRLDVELLDTKLNEQQNSNE